MKKELIGSLVERTKKTHLTPVVGQPHCIAPSTAEGRAETVIPKYCIPGPVCQVLTHLLSQLVSATPLGSRTIEKAAGPLPTSVQEPGAWSHFWFYLLTVSLN